MSRIHEALKKAEQERSAQGATPQPHLTLAAVTAPSAFDAVPFAGVPFADEQITSIGDVRDVDTMLARSQQREWNPDLGTMLFMSGNESAKGAEEFRTLRSRLYHLREKMALKTVLVTSALPKEGKSFTAANLAQVLVRQQGRRVLLVDADLRAPRLHLMLGTAAGPGLSDYLQAKSDEFSIMQRGAMENLFFIPGGTGIEDPSESIGNGRLRAFLERVEPLFDWIIVDSPPAVPVSDASILAKDCDGVLMVVRSNSTPAALARKARMEFPEQLLIGIVLNGTKRDVAPYERYYYESYQKKGSPPNTGGKT
ncbi:MAG TPA: CpsD/CapB family tyrosine-protein kinase [Candidatus Sulfotelmatobacter sp.]|jgi:capsular exopolysaccharide synthesis family protein